MQTIDAIFYINLDHRKDRLENITEQLLNSTVAKRTPIPVDKIHRISGYHNKTCGPAGCAASHVKAMDIAIENNWNRIAIFEDDFSWKENTDYIIKSLQSIDDIKLQWNVILLSTNKLCLKIVKNFPNNLQRVTNAQTTSGYIINSKEYIIKLRDLFNTCIINLNNGLPRHNWSIDMYWKKLQGTDYWYCFKDQLGKQIVSYSDVSNCVLRRHPKAF